MISLLEENHQNISEHSWIFYEIWIYRDIFSIFFDSFDRRWNLRPAKPATTFPSSWLRSFVSISPSSIRWPRILTYRAVPHSNHGRWEWKCVGKTMENPMENSHATSFPGLWSHFILGFWESGSEKSSNVTRSLVKLCSQVLLSWFQHHKNI
jgi:hypothetical protein